jgi:hypothetical protein
MTGGSRYRIETTGPKRVTPRDALEGEPAAPPCAISLECFHSICRTAWIVAAGSWQKRRNKELIAAHQPNQDQPHRKLSGSLETDFEFCNRLNKLRTELAKGRAVCGLACENYEVNTSKVAKNVKAN